MEIAFILFPHFSAYVHRTGKMRNFTEAVRPLWPVLVFMLLLLSWPILSPSNIIEKDPRALYMLSGTIFSNISVSVISCRHLQ